MKIFVFEHVSSGGMAKEQVPPGLGAQGNAMLRALVVDLQDAGIEVVTMLDHRFDMPEVTAETVTHQDDLAEIFDRQARGADATLVIAPECDGVLEYWVTRLEKAQCRHLGPDSAAIALCGDKLAMAGHLRDAAVATPPTAGLGEPAAFPVVVKPRHGAGCEHTFICRDGRELQSLPPRRDWIMQRYFEGLAASACLSVHGSAIRVLATGAQHIRTIENHHVHLQYDGGSIPLKGTLSMRTASLAQRAAATVTGLQGIVGIDVILGHDGRDVAVEINPRLTISYVGLSQICTTNLATAILDAQATIQFGGRTIDFDANGAVRDNQAAMSEPNQSAGNPEAETP